MQGFHSALDGGTPTGLGRGDRIEVAVIGRAAYVHGGAYDAPVEHRIAQLGIDLNIVVAHVDRAKLVHARGARNVGRTDKQRSGTGSQHQDVTDSHRSSLEVHRHNGRAQYGLQHTPRGNCFTCAVVEGRAASHFFATHYAFESLIRVTVCDGRRV